MSTLADVGAVRERFSSLRGEFAFFDAPGGTQVPDEVGEAIAAALRDASGNLGAPYATGRAVEGILERAKADAAGFLGCTPDEISFGMNMTTLDFAISRAAGRDFVAGDEILTTELDHDGGVAPWVELAADKGLVVKVARATTTISSGSSPTARALSRSPSRRTRQGRSQMRSASARWHARRARCRGSTRCTTRRTSRST
jgi:selenocysteine lyase/cysteine desulfurase